MWPEQQYLLQKLPPSASRKHLHPSRLVLKPWRLSSGSGGLAASLCLLNQPRKMLYSGALLSIAASDTHTHLDSLLSPEIPFPSWVPLTQPLTVFGLWPSKVLALGWRSPQPLASTWTQAGTPNPNRFMSPLSQFFSLRQVGGCPFDLSFTFQNMESLSLATLWAMGNSQSVPP